MKRATGMLLSVALLFSRCGWGACRVEASSGVPAPTAAAPIAPRTSARETAADRLREGLLACAPAIDLADCHLPASEVGALYASVLYDDPALFHVALRLSYGTATANTLSEKDNSVSSVTVVTTVYPTYTLTGEALVRARAFYRDTIEGILSDMEAAFSGHPPCEAAIALYLHDTLADRYAYDTRSPGTPGIGDAAGDTAPNADAYRLFRDGVGVCQAYALAYMALCRAAGLEACFVSSPAMNHAWNHVRIDGRWYHVDVTRDDPIVPSGAAAVVTHTRLLRSDAGMAAMGYTGASCPAGHTCTDRRYEVAAEGGGEQQTPPLAAFEEPLIPVWRGESLIFVAKCHGESTVEPRLRHGEFYGENAVSEDSAGHPTGTATGDSGRTSGTALTLAAARLTPDGVSVTAPGDLDGDGTLTPADLLCIYHPALPEAWREAIRLAVARGY